MLYSLHHVPIVDSTNAYARSHWQHLSDRTCVYCDVQRAGRGRYGRTWLADEYAPITMSYVLKREQGSYGSSFQAWTALTQYAALTLCHLLGRYGIDARIKWPNDVLVDGKKIAGILAEGIVGVLPPAAGDVLPPAAGDVLPPTAGDVLPPTAGETPCAEDCGKDSADGASAQESCLAPESFLGIVLGIGINLSLSTETLQAISTLGGYAAISVASCTGQIVDRDGFLRAYNEAFFAEYDAFMQAGFSYIHETYTDFSYSLNQTVEINTPTTRLTGKAKGFTVQGELILIDLSDPLGIEHIFTSGELV